jgi:DNA-binding HxlR family transcriptional regulator
MAEIEHGGPACDAAITLAFSVLGKRWNGMIVDALRSDRLSELASVELVSREVNAGPPVSVAYALTPAGERLIPVLTQLGEWASENLRVAHD